MEGVDPNLRMDSEKRKTPLHCAAEEGHKEICHILVQVLHMLTMHIQGLFTVCSFKYTFKKRQLGLASFFLCVFLKEASYADHEHMLLFDLKYSQNSNSVKYFL